MAGVNHYAAATSDLLSSSDCSSDDPLARYFLDRAQAHATLAVVDAIRDLNAESEGVSVATKYCDCKHLVPAGAVCGTCGHLVELHEAHEGPCTLMSVQR